MAEQWTIAEGMEEGATAMPELPVTEEGEELEETKVDKEPPVVRPKHKEKHEEEKTESQEAQDPVVHKPLQGIGGIVQP